MGVRTVKQLKEAPMGLYELVWNSRAAAWAKEYQPSGFLKYGWTPRMVGRRVLWVDPKTRQAYTAGAAERLIRQRLEVTGD